MLQQNTVWVLFFFIASLTSHTIGAVDRAVESGGEVLDQIVLGDTSSENAHDFKADRSEIIAGGLNESARQLLPLEPVSYEGGSLTFTLKVDPEKQTYFTTRFWGSDRGEERGRLMLFSGDAQIGYRTEGDYDSLNNCDSEGQCPGRFFYQTLMLPMSLTKGKSQLQLTIRSFGPVWWYGPNFAKFQKNLAAPTRGIYRIYTHTNTRFAPSPAEVQGKLQPPGVRPGPGEEVIAQSKQIVIDRITRILAQPQHDLGAAGTKAREMRMGLLAEAYHVDWTPAYHNPRAVEQLICDADDSVSAAATDAKVIEGNWLGLGPVGNALLRTWPAMKEKMDEPVALGVEHATTRRAAWASMLRRSIDYWRTHRRGYTNQSMLVDLSIYQANRGLALILPDQAMPETATIRYLYEATGIQPWRGSDDLSDDKTGNLSILQDRNEASWKFGETYRNITRKSTSREVGWVGTYGETILSFIRDIAEITGDEQIRQQLRKVQTSRMNFRYPAVDRDGYRCMKLSSEIDNRTAHYPKSGACYTAPEIGESWWMEVPALLPDDPVSVGAAQQCLADNQYFFYINDRLKNPNTLGMMRNVNEYAKVKSLPASTFRLPMGDDQPDFVFCDEENAVLAIKHGQTRLFVNLYFRAFYGINGVARVFEVSPQTMHIASVRSDFKVARTAGNYTRPDYIHSMYSPGLDHLPPPPYPKQALAGELLPVAAPPAGLKPLKPPVWGPFAGKADYYQLRYGDYLIAVNTTEDQNHELNIPADAADSCVDLVTRKSFKPGDRIPLGPLSSAVIYLGK